MVVRGNHGTSGEREHPANAGELRGRAANMVNSVMALPKVFTAVLTLLGQVFEEYHKLSGARAILVGGAAVSIFTRGAYLSGDMDVLVAVNDAFIVALEKYGFEKDKEHLRGGYFHPSYPTYYVDLNSGALFDGRADPRTVRVVILRPDSKLNLASVEDLIADRLAQFSANERDPRPLKQAKLLKKLAGPLNMTYLAKRVADEGGDLTVLG